MLVVSDGTMLVVADAADAEAPFAADAAVVLLLLLRGGDGVGKCVAA